MRIILYTGKGGVGKTSITAATGLRLAEMGYKTLVMSIDPAHSLADSFDLDRHLMDFSGGQCTSLAPNLDVQEIQIQEEIKRHWNDVYSYITTILEISGIEDVVAEELAIFPGMEEICSLLYINQYAREEVYDVVLLDCAPTGESLRFISIPTTLEWYMSKVFKLERRLARVIRPVMKQMSGLPMPGDAYFDNIESLFTRLEGIDAVLHDASVTTVRLVTNPEKMVLKETQRAFMYFCLYGLTIDGVIINRILPPEVEGEFIEGWREVQQGYLENIEEIFASVPIWRVPLFRGEVLGEAGLRQLADVLYDGIDPAATYTSEAPIRFSKDRDEYRILLRLPFIKASEIELSVVQDELIVQVASFKRHLALPRHLIGRKPEGARRKGEYLEVYFRL